MINKIKSILRALCDNVELYEVNVYNCGNCYYVQFNKNNCKYEISILEDMRLYLRGTKDTIIGSEYKISIPAEEVQEITMLCSILLNSCVEYTKNKFNEINL